MLVLLCALAVVVWLIALLPRPRTMNVTFFDVGDGLCTLVRTPSGRTLVVDCGTSSWRNTSSVGPRLVAQYLQSQGISSIDALILTHPHSDHLSGIPGLLRLEPARLVMDAGDGGRTTEYWAFVRARRACRARYRRLTRGQTLDMGDGVTAHVLSPAPDSSFADDNDQSIVLRIRYGGTSVLLEGDAGEEAEKRMIASDANLRAQVLQVGHHGSAHSTTPQWLSRVRPSVAIISCSSRSRYGFPSRRVLDRLTSCGVRTYTTARSGAVTVTTDGASIRVGTFRQSW